MRGIALNFRSLWRPVEKFVKRDFYTSCSTAGAPSQSVWTQIMADVLAVPIHQLDQPRHANTVGTALLGFERLGLIGVDDVLRIPKVKARFEPNPVHVARYDELSDHFTRPSRPPARCSVPRQPTPPEVISTRPDQLTLTSI